MTVAAHGGIVTCESKRKRGCASLSEIRHIRICLTAITRFHRFLRMKLRNHPLLTYHGLHSWPPIWVPIKPAYGTTTLKGEIGTLTHTISNALAKKCYLRMVYENAAYMGCLLCSDVAFCSQVSAVLEDNRGRTIKEIGDLDFSFTM